MNSASGTLSVIVLSAALLTGCSASVSECAGGFDGEIAPTAEGYASKTEAAEAWARTSPAPDTGWTETVDGAVADDWVLTIIKTSDGGWLVQSQRCGSALEQ